MIRDDWISRFGKPVSILSDNGSQYTGRFFEEFCLSQGIKHYFSSPYNLTGNSISERIKQTIGNILRIEKGKLLEDIIPIIESSLNPTFNRHLQCSPVELLHGSSPCDLLQRKSKVTHLDAERNIKKNAAVELNKRNRLRSAHSELQIGDLVYQRNFN